MRRADSCERIERDMPAFGKKVKEESINDKMVRLFKEGKAVHDIAMELELKDDVVTNVIRRRCGEDSIPETLIRSKNSMPPPIEDQPLKADMAVPEAPVSEEAEETVPEQTEGLSKLERFMLEKERKKAEESAAAQNTAAPAPAAEPEIEMEAVSMEGISTDNINVYEEPAVSESVSAESDIAEMDGISAEDIPEINDNEPIEELPIVSETASVQDNKSEATEDAAKSSDTDFAIPNGVSGSAFDKMKAFAQMQIDANNAKLEELEAKLGSVESDYTAQLEEAEKAVEESKVAYEDVLTRSDEINEKRMTAQTEHRAALARADEDYRKKLAALDDEYNNATAHANKVFADKEAEINAVSVTVDAEKETAKNNFLNNQAAVNGIKDKIASEVDSVKAQISALKEENAGYEKFF